MDDLWGIQDFARELDTPDSTIKDWVYTGKMPNPVEERGNKIKYYSPIPFLIAAIKHLRSKEKAPVMHPKKMLLDEARTHLICAQTEHERAKLDILKGDLLPLDEQIAIATKNIKAAKQAIDNLPTRLAPILAPISDPLEIRDILFTELNRALTEISNALE